MAALKTSLNDSSAEAFLQTVADDSRRRDSFTLLQMMQQVTKEKPKMLGGSIVALEIIIINMQVEDKEIGLSPAFHHANRTLPIILCGDLNDIKN